MGLPLQRLVAGGAGLLERRLEVLVEQLAAIASVSRYHGVTPPSVAAIGIESGYLHAGGLELVGRLAELVNVARELLMPALANIFLL